jgi:hypothetical protein
LIKFNGKPIAGRPARQMLRENMGKRVTVTLSQSSVTMDRLVRPVSRLAAAEPKNVSHRLCSEPAAAAGNQQG